MREMKGFRVADPGFRGRVPGQPPPRHRPRRPGRARAAHGALPVQAPPGAARHRHRRGVRAPPGGLPRDHRPVRRPSGSPPSPCPRPTGRHAVREWAPPSPWTRRRSTGSPRPSRTSGRAARAPSPNCPNCGRGGGEGPVRRLWELVEALDALPRGIAMHPCGVLLSDASLLARTPVMPQRRGASRWPVRQGGRRGPRAAQARRARGADAVRDGVRGWPRSSGPGASGSDLTTSGAEDGDVPADRAPRRWAASRSSRRASATWSAGSSRDLPRPGGRHLALPAGSGRRRHGAALHRGPARGRAPVRYPHPDLEGPLRDVRRGRLPRADHRDRRHHDRLRADQADRVRRRALRPRVPGRSGVWFARGPRRGYDAEIVGRAWEIVEAFGAYGFCKAHAVAFAVPTYQSAWLKAHPRRPSTPGCSPMTPGCTRSGCCSRTRGGAGCRCCRWT